MGGPGGPGGAGCGVRGAETVAALSAKRLAPESASAYEGAQHIAR